MNYRPEVDGLRAVAVLAVIANHFSASVLPGGFLGVDVFFVISGYVITASLTKHPAGSAQEFFLGFYARRMKRIVPALIVCVIVTALFGSLFIESGMPEYASSMKTGLFALFGFSNFFLYLEAIDYFGSSAHLNLFTHTWSLGVEEQFYFVFPLLFWLTGLGWLATKGRVAALSVLAVASFALFVWQSSSNPDAAYYLMFSRFWELSIGCIIAVVLNGRRLNAPLLPWAGALELGVAFGISAEHSVYTTPAAVLGTTLIIAAARPGDMLYRLLALKPAVAIGLISYSLYLWHWPVISISRWTIGVDQWTFGPQLVAMFGLATLSYAYVEKPLRRAEWSSGRLLTIGYGLGGSAAAATLIWALVVGFIGPFYSGSPAQLVAKGVQTLTDEKTYNGKTIWRATDCVLTSNNDVGKEIGWKSCMVQINESLSDRSFLVIGNSYSAAMFEMYSVLAERGIGRVVATSSWGASPSPDLENKTRWSEAHQYYWKTVVPELISHLKAGDVLLMVSNSNQVVRGAQDKVSVSRRTLENDLSEIASAMSERGVSVIYMSQPSLAVEAKCTPDMAKKQWFERSDTGRCNYPTHAYSVRMLEPLLDILSRIEQRHSNFYALDLFAQFCPEEICKHTTPSGIFLYRDIYGHPSVEASYAVRPAFLEVVKRAISVQAPLASAN